VSQSITIQQHKFKSYAESWIFLWGLWSVCGGEGLYGVARSSPEEGKKCPLLETRIRLLTDDSRKKYMP